uniref:Uncharacterized protein n=1 Tax=Staphylococcus aureus TaxID=1280 RepID=D2J8C7_STAAU|nr:hypothetical protein [Staphylococcus aureus]ACZ59027.1 hypothetical protein SAP040A_045 [Staphylococcus aureus]
MKNNHEELFNNHFYKQDNKESNKNYVNVELKLHTDTTEQQNIAKHFNSMVKRFKTSLEFYDRADMLNTYATLFYMASTQLETLEDIETLKANPGIYKERLSYIKTVVTHEFALVANPNTTVLKSGNERYYLTPEVYSIDAPADSNDDCTDELSDTLGEEANLFHMSNVKAHHNHMITWFLENKEDILTRKQLEVYNTLSEIYQPRVDNTRRSNDERAQMLEDAGISKKMMNDYFRNIKKRVTQKYEQEFNGIYHSHQSQNYMKLDEMITEYTRLANYPYETQVDRQDALAVFLEKAYDNYEFEKIATEGLTKEEKRSIVGAIRDIPIERKRRIDHRLLRIIKQNLTKYQETHQLEDKHISIKETIKPEIDLKAMSSQNLILTPTGSFVAKQNTLALA